MLVIQSFNHLGRAAAILRDVVQGPAKGGGQLSHHLWCPDLWVQTVLHDACENSLLGKSRCHGGIMPLCTCSSHSDAALGTSSNPRSLGPAVANIISDTRAGWHMGGALGSSLILRSLEPAVARNVVNHMSWQAHATAILQHACLLENAGAQLDQTVRESAPDAHTPPWQKTATGRPELLLRTLSSLPTGPLLSEPAGSLGGT